jgi:epoxyqueuosine reductase
MNTCDPSFSELARRIKAHAETLGFQQCGITDTALDQHSARYRSWLAANYHGDLGYMVEHGSKRWVPEQLIPGTLRVISVRMNYFADPENPMSVLQDRTRAYVSRYSLGRDYHKLMRQRLKKLADFIQQTAQENHFRPFVDSAPVLERALAQKAGLGWFGKNTLLLNRKAGSWFFLGEIYTDLPLALDPPYTEEHCGSCRACLDACPTNAFVGPYVLDARRCISYLTIEHRGSIPESLRPGIGNRIFGCDDCQLVCPWNRFRKPTGEADFSPRHQLDKARLVELFRWDEETFLRLTEGSPIRRAGYQGWLRNIAVALGNAPTSIEVIEALRARVGDPSELVREHVQWALRRHGV